MSEPKDFGNFEILERIGRGGMASVYLAVQKALDRKVVLKILFPHLAEDANLVARFEREARAAARLHHENIIQIIDCGRHEDVSYIAMEFVDGKDLKQWLEATGALPLEMAVLILREMFRGLEHAHQNGIVHRDIKPANVMLATEGTVKLMDFGLARRDSDSKGLTVMGSLLGTPAYMSPEQAKSERVDERSDIFSAGVVAYELLGGGRPFDGSSYTGVLNAILSVQPPRLREVNPLAPPELEALVQKMLQKEPEARYQKLSQARADLETVIERMGLLRAKDLLREYAQHPREVTESLREKQLRLALDRGRVLAAAGPDKIDEALQEFVKALYLEPHNAEAIEQRKKLDRARADAEARATAQAEAAAQAEAMRAAAPRAPAPPAPAPPAPASAAGRAVGAPEPRAQGPSVRRPGPSRPAGKPDSGRSKADTLRKLLFASVGALALLVVVAVTITVGLQCQRKKAGESGRAAVETPSQPVIPPVATEPVPEQQEPIPDISAMPLPNETAAGQVATPTPAAGQTGAPDTLAWLALATDPPGATVLINGRAQGKLTNSSYAVPPGARVEVRKTGYSPRTLEEAGKLRRGEKRSLLVNLTPVDEFIGAPGPGEGGVDIRVQPAARFYIGSTLLPGSYQTLQLHLKPGTHVIRAGISQSDFHDWTVEVRAGASVTLEHVFTPTVPGAIKIDTGRTKAAVYLNGQEQPARAPCTIENLKPASYTLKVVAQGFRPDSQVVTVKAKETSEIRFRLKKE